MVSSRMTLLAAASLWAIVMGPAAAQFSVTSPKVEKGEFEVEIKGSVQIGLPTDDDGEEEGNRAGHEVEFEYGVTENWRAGLALTIQKPEGESYDLNSIEFENVFELGTFGHPQLTVGFLASVSAGIADGEPNSFEFGPLFEFGNDERSLIINTTFEKTFGPDREEGLTFEYALQYKRTVRGPWAWGVEAYGEVDDITDPPSFSDTELRIGPVLYFSRDDNDNGNGSSKDGDDDDRLMKRANHAPELSGEIGVLFGVTRATPDVTVKWGLELEF